MKSENEILEHDNRCLQEQIAALEGRPVHHKNDPAARVLALGESLDETNSRIAQYLLDSEAAIEDHNRRHPESPWANSEAVLKLMCGDCTKERANSGIRNSRGGA